MPALARPRSAPYRAHGAGLALWTDRRPEVILSGPAGCIAPETRIVDPITGEHPRVVDLHRRGIAPTVLTMWGPARAEVPFLKGVADLYRIRTEAGGQCLVTADHLIFTPQGWTFAGSLAPGDMLLSPARDPLPSSWESCPPGSPRDARHWTRTTPGCSDRCSTCRHPCGGLPPPGATGGRVSVPSQVDALAHSRDGLPRDGRGDGSGCTPTCPTAAHPSMTGCSAPIAGMAYTESRASAGTTSRVVCSSPIVSPSPIGTHPPSRVGGQGRDCSSTPHLSPRSAQVRPNESRSGLDSGSPSILPRLPWLSWALDGVPGPVAVELQSGACIPSLWPPKLYYTGQWDRITSVTYERTGEYFDLSVPGPAHYLAEGFWHHNTGKSRACLEKVHACCLRWPGARWLIVRKSRESLTESGLVTFESKVLPRNSPIADGPQRRMRQAYHYPNGSEVVVGGLDKPSKVMSTEYDGVYVQEAIEVFENDWESLTTRLRNGVMPFQQLIADTNPDAPTHWLKRRADAGRAAMLESRHEDNPLLWDTTAGDWTEFGRSYISKLEALTGARYQRLRHGRWVSAEGVVYEGWDRNIHVIAEPFSAIRRYVASVDWGFSGPGVLQVWGVDGDGRMYLVREHYRTKQLIGWWLAKAVEVRDEFRPEAFVCDPAEPGFIQEFQNAKLPAFGAFNDIRPGIQAVMDRLAPAGDGRRRLYVLRDSTIGVDPDLVEAKKPTGLVDEFDSYMWPRGVEGRAIKELPVDADNHGADAMRYAVSYVDHLGSKHLGGPYIF